MHKAWRYLYLGYLWALPMSVAGFAIAWWAYKARSWVWFDGVLTCVAGVHPNGVTRIWGRPQAQTLGWVQIYDTEDSRQLPDLRVHENVHVGQSFAGGLLGILLLPLLFMVVGWSWLTGLVLGGFAGAIGFNAIYGILFVYLLIKRPKLGWYWAYRDNPFEIQAYDLQDKYIANPNTRPWGT
jgi:hypothetical protein